MGLSPRDMVIEGLLAFQSPGNYRKRLDRLTRLAHETQTEIYYSLTETDRTIGVCRGDDYYETKGLRDAENLLRWLKRMSPDSRT